MIYSFHKIYHSIKHNKGHILFHQIQNTVKLTFSLNSHTTTTTALLTQVSIQAARFCWQKPFSSFRSGPLKSNHLLATFVGGEYKITFIF